MRKPHPHRRPGNAGLTLAELAAVIAVLVVIVVLLLPWSRWSAEAGRNACAGNLKQMGLSFSLYASESPGNRYPPRAPNCFAPDIAALYPDYMTDFMPLVCTEAGNFDVLDRTNPEGWYNADGSPRLDILGHQAGDSYAYLGFAIPNNAWLGPAGAARDLLEHAFANLDEDDAWNYHPSPNVKNATLYRIHSGVERILADEGHLPSIENGSRLATMWDNIRPLYDATVMMRKGASRQNIEFNHIPDGSNVLFLDGHVEFVEYGAGRFPVTDEYVYVGLGETGIQ